MKKLQRILYVTSSFGYVVVGAMLFCHVGGNLSDNVWKAATMMGIGVIMMRVDDGVRLLESENK